MCSAGIPNWQKLYEMGKLPKDARGKVSGLAQLDAAEKKIKELEEEIAKLKGVNTEDKPKEGVIIKKDEKEQDSFAVKCKVEGCDYTAKGKSEAWANNILRMHGKTHEVKKTPDDACSEHSDGCPEGSHK